MRRLCVTLCLVAVLFPGRASADSAWPHLDPVKVQTIQHLTVLLDMLPQKTYPLTLQNSKLIVAEWEAEILPMYAHLGIVSLVTPPAQISFFFQPYGPAEDVDGYTYHLLGLSACSTLAGMTPDLTPVVGPVWLNGRYINPVSPWYQDPSFLPTLVHELGHSVGICKGASDYVESSTQVATVEVLAGLVNAGLDGAVLGLLSEYRDMAWGALKYEAFKGHLESEYEAFFVATEGKDPRKLSQHYASQRNWHGTQKEYAALLFKYSYVPWQKLQYGLRWGSLKASFKRGYIGQAHVLVPSGKPLSLAELAYFLAHADERVAALAG